jgi:hypothetical protein
LDGAGTHVDSQHWFAVDRLAEVHKFVGAKLVGLNRLPGQITAARALLLGANAVKPIIAAEEVAARVAHDGVLLFAQRGQHISAQAVFVGQRGGGVIDAFIDAAAHLLGKAAKEQGRDFRNGAVGVQINLCCIAHSYVLTILKLRQIRITVISRLPKSSNRIAIKN